MKLERVRPGVVHLELHAMELTALVTAARWVTDGAEGGLPSAAVDQLRQVLDRYDDATQRPGPRSRP